MFSRNSRAWAVAASLAAACTLTATLSLAGTAEASSAKFDPKIIRLHSRYEQTLSRQQPVHMAGVFYGSGKAPRIAVRVEKTAAGSTCVEPDCPLVYNGGTVQQSPHVYLLLWGPQWESNSSEHTTAVYLQSFLQGLGVQPQDTWSRTLQTYGATFSGSVFAGTWEDPETPPAGANPVQFAAEAEAFALDIGITNDANTQIVVASQSGICPLGSNCAGDGGWCSYHADSLGTTGVPFIELPYILDAGSGTCDNYALGGTEDGFSIDLGHEYAETITDPYNFTGWWDSAMGLASGEVADKCDDNGDFSDVDLSTGAFPVQQLFSNAAYNATGQGCTFAWPDNITVPNPGTLSTPVHTSVDRPVNAVSSAGYPLSYAGYLPPGLSINSVTGLISGTPTATGTFGTSVDVTDESGAFASAIFNWTITSTGDTVTVGSPGAEDTYSGFKESLQVTATSSGGHPITFSATGLPPGLSISSTGLISGTPRLDGDYTVRVFGTDSAGAVGAVDFPWQITTFSPPVCGGKTRICKS
jgi:hypothetical protein